MYLNPFEVLFQVFQVILWMLSQLMPSLSALLGGVGYTTYPTI